MKKYLVLMIIAAMAIQFTGCGNAKNDKNSSTAAVESSAVDNSNVSSEEESNESITDNNATDSALIDLVTQIYVQDQINKEWAETLSGYPIDEITSDLNESIFGTSDIKYKEAVVSQPMMSSIAYQLVLVRAEDGQDIEELKNVIKNNADPRKWICVEAEKVVVENKGDIILFLMSEDELAGGIATAFNNIA